MINTVKNKFTNIIFGFLVFLLFFPLLSFAQGAKIPGPGGSKGTISNPLKFDSIQEFLVALLDVIIVISIPIIVFFMIYAGFLFVTAQGSEDKINTAKKVILYTIIGAVIILGAKAIATAIEATVKDLSNSTHKQLVMESNIFNL